jgi:hypothetical protein
MEYTKGEWKVTKSSSFKEQYAIQSVSSNYIIATTFPTIGAKSRDNANLISAAPDMYEALKRVEKFLFSCSNIGRGCAPNSEFMSSITKVLAKAEE